MKLRELRKKLEAECFAPHAYALGPEWKDRFEVFALDKVGATWQIFYAERGERRILEETRDETVACEHFYEQLCNHRGARTHMVGMYPITEDAEALVERLRGEGLESRIDEFVLRAGPAGKRYRVFVEGCDIVPARKIAGSLGIRADGEGG